VAVSKAIFQRYGLDDDDSFCRIDTPRVFDGLNDSISSLASNRIIDFKNRSDILLFIGRCENRKGFDYLLEIWKKVQVDFPTFNLVLIGDTIENQRKASTGTDNVRQLGFVSSIEKSELLAKAKIVVIPSRYESFGIVTIEALSFGTPVIVSRIGGLGNIAEESQSVLVCEVGDVDCFVFQILKCLRDISLWSSLSSRSREDFVERYSLSNL
jgi:glycosyltransferase involved in cell wall biosynthesis